MLILFKVKIVLPEEHCPLVFREDQPDCWKLPASPCLPKPFYCKLVRLLREIL